MKRVVSVSLGSSKRNHTVQIEILGQMFSIERVGTDGDVKKAMEIIASLDGKVNAIGLGGTDLYIYAGGKRYTFRESLKLKNCAPHTPVVDGSSLKNTLERRVIEYLARGKGWDFTGKKVLLVSGADRFGMAEALQEAGAELILGDLIFGLGIPVPLHSLTSLSKAARLLAPVIVQLPIRFIYPTGAKQEVSLSKFEKFYQEADIIAGDYHFIKRYMPQSLTGKMIITNTVTMDDVAEMRRRNANLLVTTTPEFGGRSFGTNVMEGILVSLAPEKGGELTREDFEDLLDRIHFEPRIIDLQEESRLSS
ncbi:quinate 5-dehydrogenase [Dehalobacterium formicoaceticum]|uniref:Quinate 5-dehydrogenase n=1 Tax=Dehalobacterium formicoaceticum TaxID=51515 RepID=A0ABT1Y337_9FIRM|nr:quinate 5-dehydrogenase [Dehalobacterium formicoaceticum]MCR6545286.1 quinate 5-dehydrogenase [Dehalobacterium formicoaceticum]